jgi:hypothetical protein
MDIFRRSKKTNDGDLIDGILDSDEDGPEIFTDNDEDSDDNNNNNNGVNDTPNSKKSALSATDQFKEVLQMLEKGASNDEDDDDEDEGSSSEDGEKSGSDSAEDYTDDEDEGEDGYKPGGYHPVKVGEIYNQRCVSSMKKALGVPQEKKKNKQTNKTLFFSFVSTASHSLFIRTHCLHADML